MLEEEKRDEIIPLPQVQSNLIKRLPCKKIQGEVPQKKLAKEAKHGMFCPIQGKKANIFMGLFASYKKHNHHHHGY